MVPRKSNVRPTRLTFGVGGRWTAEDMAVFLLDLSSLYNIRLALDIEPRLLRYPRRFGPWGPEPWWDWMPESPGAPLEVRRIEYASPGVIEIKGIDSAIEQLRILIETSSDSRRRGVVPGSRTTSGKSTFRRSE